jgi:large subunit ribosomal protein L10
MNREQKAATIAALTEQIEQAEAIFAVDYRGISVPQVAELRSRLKESDATFRVVKNSLTQLAAERAGATGLADFLEGPTALAFVRGDSALAAKAIADYARMTQLLPFKGGVMGSEALVADQVREISRLPSRDVLHAQLVGLVASPVGGLVRTLGALIGGLAVALGQVREKKDSGEIPAGQPPAEASADEAEPTAAAEPAAEPDAKVAPAAEPDAEVAPAAEPDAEGEPAAEPADVPEATSEPAAAPEPTPEPAGAAEAAVEPDAAAEPAAESAAVAAPEPTREPAGAKAAAEPDAAAEPAAEPDADVAEPADVVEPDAAAEPAAESTPDDNQTDSPAGERPDEPEATKED